MCLAGIPQDQIAELNTNTRYLYEGLAEVRLLEVPRDMYKNPSSEAAAAVGVVEGAEWVSDSTGIVPSWIESCSARHLGGEGGREGGGEEEEEEEGVHGKHTWHYVG